MFTPPPSPMPSTKPIDSSSVSGAASLKHSDMDKDTLHIPLLHLDGVPMLDSDMDMDTSTSPPRPWDDGSISVSKEPGLTSAMDAKRRIGRRTRWTVLLVPAVLLLVGLTSRHLSHNVALEELIESSHLDGSSPFHGLGHSSSHHLNKRVPLPDPQPQSQTLSNTATPTESSLITATSQLASATTLAPQTSQTIPLIPDPSSPPALPTPFPQPYDSTGATSNLSTIGCQNFFNNMTQSLDFRQCRPLSLLEQFSDDFIQAQTNLTGLNTLLFGTCSTVPSFDTCTQNMASFASLLQSACSKELSQQNALVMQTLLGLQAYPIVRTAGCLADQSTNVYCYAFAVHEANPADLYLYSLPLGEPVPDSSKMTCSPCAGSLFGVYAEALQVGNDSATGLKTTYENAAKMAESKCGDGYVQLGLASGALSMSALRGLGVLGKDGWIAGLWIWSLLVGVVLMMM